MTGRPVWAALLGAAALCGAIALWCALPEGAPPKLSEGSPFEGIPQEEEQGERPTPPKAREERLGLEETEILVALVTRPSTRPEQRREALQLMQRSPRVAWVPALRALLASEQRAAELFPDTTPNAFIRTTRCSAVASVKVLALRVAWKSAGREGIALVREVAEDRARSEPDPLTLAALEAHDEGKRQDPDLSRAVASLRLMALAVLDDRALIHAAATDPSEPELIRRWARLMDRPGPTTMKRFTGAGESVVLPWPICL